MGSESTSEQPVIEFVNTAVAQINRFDLQASKSVWTLPELSNMGLTKVPILSYDHTHASTVHMPSDTLMTEDSSSFQDQCIACEHVSVCLSVCSPSTLLSENNIN
jgi:hypothetical protein